MDMSVTRHRSPSHATMAMSCPPTASRAFDCSVGSSTSTDSACVKSAVTVPVAGGSPVPSKLVECTSKAPPTR